MKTATTTIQTWLNDSEVWLAEQGWSYPGWPLRSASLIRDKVATLPDGHNIVISDEGLWHFSGERSNTAEIADILSEFDVTVIVYFRRPDKFIESWFKQGIKNGTGQHDIASFLESPELSSRAILTRINRFAKLFGEKNIVVAPYERVQFHDGNIISDFIARTGLPRPEAESDAQLKAHEYQNISPSADVILMAGMMRQVFQQGQDEIDRLLRTPPCVSVLNTRSSLLTAAEASAIRADFRPIFAHIHKRFQSGASPAFFVDWGDGGDAPQVSPMRNAYDQYMSIIRGAERRDMPLISPPASFLARSGLKLRRFLGMSKRQRREAIKRRLKSHF